MTILSENQRRVLDALSSEQSITSAFYFGGGTVLAEYYLQHRYSEDLDFFSETEFDPAAVSAFFQSAKKRLGITGVRYEQAFNRNLFFLDIGKETIKAEFTFFPFARIDAGERREAFSIDSLLDIAVNKIFTIYQKPRARDFIDLFCIIKKEGWQMAELADKAQAKFETYLDPLQLGSQFLRSAELHDYPRMIAPLAPEDWQAFFREEAKKLRPDVLE